MSRMAGMGKQFVKKAMSELHFDNKALQCLPVDTSMISGSRQVPNSCFSLVNPTPVKNPQLVVSSASALSLLDIGNDTASPDELAQWFSGNKILKGSKTAAHCYCGHQFGYFSGQLGDGAAIYLGEILNNSGKRWEIQVKGAGPTPYSRSSDGRKVLRSSIREFLCSEAMHHLGIPTTRAGTCVTSDSTVIRDIFYDGHPKQEKCTIVLRISQTFLRFGSFEIFKPTDEVTGRTGPSVDNKELLLKMLDYVVNTFYTDITADVIDKEEKYVQMFKEVCIRTAHLVAKWQTVGFCHGVLNTDNMSIIGVTIDYGPFGFMDRFDKNFICNGSDDGGRYAYQKQPEICKWNLEKFAEAIKDAVSIEKTLPHLQTYQTEYEKEYLKIMRNKLGLLSSMPDDGELVEELFLTMQQTSCDFTNAFLSLMEIPHPSADKFEESLTTVLDLLTENCNTLEELKLLHKPQMDPQQLQMILSLVRENPSVLQALTGGKVGIIKREMDNMEKIAELQSVTLADYNEQLKSSWKKWLEKYATRLKNEKCDGSVNQLQEQRKSVMGKTNPRFILRNHIAQSAIEKAEQGNYEEVREVLRKLEDPFNHVQREETSVQTASCAQEFVCEKPSISSLTLKVT